MARATRAAMSVGRSDGEVEFGQSEAGVSAWCDVGEEVERSEFLGG